jgi:FKBP-type peptidyl-prolyl cis-trans isomerase FkpA
MKRIFLFGAVVVASATMLASCCNSNNSATPALKTDLDTLAYAIGYDMGAQIKNIDSTINPNVIASGIRDYIAGSSKMTKEDMRKFMEEYFMVRVPMKNAQASKEFLAKVEKEEGVVKTESGLLYKVLEPGLEDRPTSLQDTVMVHYKGMLKNGKIFESSYTAGEVVRFPLNRVIKGWGEGLQYVGKGGRIILYIPAELAYAERGAGVFIGPNEALIFDVELIDVVHVKADKNVKK